MNKQDFIDAAIAAYHNMFGSDEFDETNVCSLECLSKNRQYILTIDIQIRRNTDE